jgi:hypothetical protein
LRFPWVPVTKSPEDFHLQVSAHAGRTSGKGPASPRKPSPSPRGIGATPEATRPSPV